MIQAPIVIGDPSYFKTRVKKAGQVGDDVNNWIALLLLLVRLNSVVLISVSH